MKKLVVVTGASGAGKTTIAKELERDKIHNLVFCYFDSVGVPSPEVMAKEFGGQESWQRTKTEDWVEMIKNKYLGDEIVLLDGQIRPVFVELACKKQNIENYEVVLIDCSDKVRRERLIERGHPNLVNSEMMNWAKVLREECGSKGYNIIDTTRLDLERSKVALFKLLQ